MAGPENNELDLYLASASPRRRELLKQIGIRFEVISGIDIDESQHETETPERYVGRLARDKALAGYFRISSRLEGEYPNMPPVLGADTCITIDGDIVGKPASKDDGVAILQRLSGRSHKVLTAISLFDGSKERYSLCQSIVSIKTLELDEIEHYWESGEPVDKAGAYAIQGIGARFVTHLQGSYSSVVGLPLYELSELLQSSRK